MTSTTKPRVGIQRVTIAELGLGMSNTLVVGLVLAKTEPRTFPSKKYPDSETCVFNFTLRDSPNDIINVSCWGDPPSLRMMAESFHLAEIVEIINARVSFRQVGDQEDKFHPVVTSPYQLTISERHSSCKPYDGSPDPFLPLLQMPTKPITDFLNLADIQSSTGNLEGQTADLLVAVRSVRPIKEITSRDGRHLVCRDVLVLDRTCSGLILQLWDAECCHRAETWIPRETVIFVADARLNRNEFHRSMVASTGSQTIITENPFCAEAEALKEYAQCVPLDTASVLDSLLDSSPDPSTINTVYTVKRIVDTIEDPGSSESKIEALLYSMVTQLDLDGCTRITNTTCSRCLRTADWLTRQCLSEECPSGLGIEPQATKTTFDIKVNLSDHTGTLKNCRLIGHVAEKVLGVTIEQFDAMSIDERTYLKWRFLLERCAVRLVVLLPGIERTIPLMTILSCELADPNEVAARSRVY